MGRLGSLFSLLGVMAIAVFVVAVSHVTAADRKVSVHNFEVASSHVYSPLSFRMLVHNESHGKAPLQINRRQLMYREKKLLVQLGAKARVSTKTEMRFTWSPVHDVFLKGSHSVVTAKSVSEQVSHVMAVTGSDRMDPQTATDVWRVLLAHMPECVLLVREADAPIVQGVGWVRDDGARSRKWHQFTVLPPNEAIVEEARERLARLHAGIPKLANLLSLWQRHMKELERHGIDPGHVGPLRITVEMRLREAARTSDPKAMQEASELFLRGKEKVATLLLPKFVAVWNSGMKELKNGAELHLDRAVLHGQLKKKGIDLDVGHANPIDSIQLMIADAETHPDDGARALNTILVIEEARRLLNIAHRNFLDRYLLAEEARMRGLGNRWMPELSERGHTLRVSPKKPLDGNAREGTWSNAVRALEAR